LGIGPRYGQPCEINSGIDTGPPVLVGTPVFSGNPDTKNHELEDFVGAKFYCPHKR